jgi:hypothetical protein
MAAGKATDAVKQITYLAGALKAPRITEAAGRMADQARDAGWSFEDYLAAVLEREVSARNASGAELRIKAAGFPARKTLEDFDWDAQPTARQQIAALASGGFLLEAQTSCSWGRQERGRRISQPLLVSSPRSTDIECCSRRRRTGSLASPTRIVKAGCRKSSPGCAATV